VSRTPKQATSTNAGSLRASRARSLGGRGAAVTLCILSLGLAGCGESSAEKAAKTVCTETAEINTQLEKLKTLPISSSFPSEAKGSVEAIGNSIKKIDEAAPNLDTARKQEIEAANTAFQSEIVTITKSVVSATTSSNLNAALKSAEPQIKASLDKLATDYKHVFEALKCS
jgi:hypothetical protein